MIGETTTPAAEPTSTSSPSATTTEPSGDSPGFDFGALASHDDNAEPAAPSSESVGVPPTAAATVSPSSAPPAGATAPSPSAAPATTPGLAAAATPPPAQPEQPGTQPPAATATPATEASTPELTIEQHKEKFLPMLAGIYKLSDAEVEELRINPGEALPKLGAQLHYNVQMAVYQGILSVLPQVISQQMQAVETHSGHEKAFFGQWPALQDAVKSNPEAKKVVINAISTFRQMNPKASLEDTIAHAGLLAMMSLKLPLPVPGAGTPTPQVANGAVTGTPFPSSPPRPPGVGTTGHVPPASASGTDDGGSLINDIVNEHLAGNI